MTFRPIIGPASTSIKGSLKSLFLDVDPAIASFNFVGRATAFIENYFDIDFTHVSKSVILILRKNEKNYYLFD